MSVYAVMNGSRSIAQRLNDLRERWQLRKEKDINSYVPVVLFKEDLTKLDRAQLVEMLQELNKILGDVKNKIDGRKLPDHDRLMREKVSVGNHLQAVVLQLAAINEKRNASLENKFVDVAKRVLDKDTFSAILNEAHNA